MRRVRVAYMVWLDSGRPRFYRGFWGESGAWYALIMLNGQAGPRRAGSKGQAASTTTSLPKFGTQAPD